MTSKALQRMALPGEWEGLLRQFKEKLAERLWALPTVTETEKEMVFKEYLGDLDRLERALSEFQQVESAERRMTLDENELLRSLMGVAQDEIKLRLLGLSQDLNAAENARVQTEEEASELRGRTAELAEENAMLRKKIGEFQKQAEEFRMRQIKLREEDIKYFGETHEVLKNQLKDLESRLVNLRSLFTESNQQLLTAKQEEISLLQKKLLDEMESTLRKKQELMWGEEEMFANGIAHRVRTALVSAQGQLLFSLERLGVLDPETNTEAFWKTRLKLLTDGAEDLAKNFRAVQSLLQNVTGTLDDYLHLTRRHAVVKTRISLKEMVQGEMADIYVSRQPALSVEFLSDDPLPEMDGDPALIKFIVKTLFQNALEAMPGESGKVVVALKNRSNKNLIQLTVRDSGSGIPDHLIPRLFQPFFTTKDNRQGLSLSRAKRYAELHGGSLELIQSGPGGSTFQVELPLTAKLILDGAR